MKTDGKIKLALKLYPIYEAMSGDLLFYSVIEMLFLTLVKGFSNSEIALILVIVNAADLALEYPSYRLIRRLGNSRSVVLGGIMPVLAIVFLTLGQSIVPVIIGNILFVSAGNFQSMACAGARNNLSLTGERNNYAKLFSRGNMIYTGLSMAAAIIAPFMFSCNRYLPSAVCFITYVLIAVISLYIPDYTEKGFRNTRSKDDDKKNYTKKVKLSAVFKYILGVFCIYFCAIIVFSNNSELLMSNTLGCMFDENRTIFIYGAVIWISRIIRFITNAFISSIIDKYKEKVVIAGSFILLISFALTGLSGIFFRGTMQGFLVIAAMYIIVKGIIWDPMRILLRMKAVDTNSKKRQQLMLTLLNAGQSVVSIIMRLIVLAAMNIAGLEYVFPVFALIMAAELVLAIKLAGEMKKEKELLKYETVLSEEEIDNTVQMIVDLLERSGMERKLVLSYRLIVEERLLERLKDGHRGEDVMIVLTLKQDELDITLTAGGEQIDVFGGPKSSDEFSSKVFSRLFMNIDI